MSFTVMHLGLLAVLAQTPASSPAVDAKLESRVCEKVNGYRSLPLNSLMSAGTSGPVACYSAKAGRTFFVYPAAASGGKAGADLCIGCYEHIPQSVIRPRVVATLPELRGAATTLDDEGHVWVFAGAGGSGEVNIFRSARPDDIEAFLPAGRLNLREPQVFHQPRGGFLVLDSEVGDQSTRLRFRTGSGDRHWSEPRSLCDVPGTQQAVSWQQGDKIGVLLAVRPPDNSEVKATRIYYLETADDGKTWVNAARQAVEVPIRDGVGSAPVREYAITRVIHLQDVNFDSRGNPVGILVMSRASQLGRPSAPGRRLWTTLRYTGREWEDNAVIYSDNDDDGGCIHIDEGLLYEVVAPTMPGPAAKMPGGDMYIWRSKDQGRSYNKQPLTEGSGLMHNLARRPLNAHPHFYTLWFGAAPPDEQAPARLFFADKGGLVHALPPKMDEDVVKIELLETEPHEHKH